MTTKKSPNTPTNSNKPSSIYTTLRQRLITVLPWTSHFYSLPGFNGYRSTYYKFLNHTPSARDKDNAYIRSCILALHSKYKKRLGADKLRICLRNEYCLQISTGRVYRLLKTMHLPQMSTVKPFSRKNAASSAENCTNILKQRFNPAKPNAAWVCDMTYLRAAGRFFYLCVILDLFSRKVIAYKLSRKNDSKLALGSLYGCQK